MNRRDFFCTTAAGLAVAGLDLPEAVQSFEDDFGWAFCLKRYPGLYADIAAQMNGFCQKYGGTWTLRPTQQHVVYDIEWSRGKVVAGWAFDEREDWVATGPRGPHIACRICHMVDDINGGWVRAAKCSDGWRLEKTIA